MKFRRKSAEEPLETTASPDAPEDVEPVDADAAASAPASSGGPRDVDDVEDLDDVERVDLGSLLLTAVEGLEIRLQVDEGTDQVQSVLHAGPDGAVELRAFAAPRHGDLWGEIRPRIAADLRTMDARLYAKGPMGLAADFAAAG